LGHAAARPLTWSAALRLGRVSNLPTVWTNVLAGAVLAGASPASPWLPALLAAFSLSYVAGMYLNDWFDRALDAAERPGRPIPSGEARPDAVLAAGAAMLGAGALLLAWTGYAAGTGWAAGLAAATLAGAIVVYDWNHKANPLSPVVMGVCRVLVYVGTGAALAGTARIDLLAGAAALLCYLVGLTYVARQEASDRLASPWPLLLLAVPVVYGLAAALPDPVACAFWLLFLGWTAWSLSFLLVPGRLRVPKAVGHLIAGICLFDAVVLAAWGHPGPALAAVAAFVLTLALQRRIPGT
jgi:4-hydroxybenzoate polyprenyltransferase